MARKSTARVYLVNDSISRYDRGVQEVTVRTTGTRYQILWLREMYYVVECNHTTDNDLIIFKSDYDGSLDFYGARVAA